MSSIVEIKKEDMPKLSRKFTAINKNIDKIVYRYLYPYRKDKNKLLVNIKSVKKELELIKMRTLEIEYILEKYE